MNHYGNLDIYGRLAVGQNISGGYQLPEQIGDNLEFLGVEDKQTGKLKFISVGGLVGSSVKSGIIECVVNQRIYEVSYGSQVLNSIPVVSLVIPSEDSDVFIQGIFDISTSGFKVALSNTPDIPGYYLNWIVKEN